MPKLKTHRGASKRFHITGRGKLLRLKGARSHLRRRKTAKVKRLFDNKLPVSATVVKRMRLLLPYGVE